MEHRIRLTDQEIDLIIRGLQFVEANNCQDCPCLKITSYEKLTESRLLRKRLLTSGRSRRNNFRIKGVMPSTNKYTHLDKHHDLNL